MHDAARDGGLLALQQALDRRKFAIAKADISPNGATALHVAVLFGHSGKLYREREEGVQGGESCHTVLYMLLLLPLLRCFRLRSRRHRALFGLTLSGDHGNYG